LYYGFGKPAVGVPKSIPKKYSLSWPEEIFGAVVFFVSFMAVWDVYQLVPMLMALGIATVTTFVALRTLRLFTASNLAFYKYSLKSAGSIQKAGYGFLAFATLWIGLNAHSGWVRYHERAGALAFQSLTIPDELALAKSDPSPWIDRTERKIIADGRKHFNTAAKIGLFTNTFAISKLAWLEYLSGNTERAVQLLSEAAEVQDGEGKALSLYYRGAILNRMGRYEQAQTSLDEALTERPDLILAREEKGESLWQLGRRQEAVTIWVDAVERNPDLVITNNQLAGAATILALSDEAARYEKKADDSTPSDPRFHWMVGLRLQNIGMKDLARKHFDIAKQLDPSLETRLEWNSLNQK
jgi:tetratricopeptide (TPR) repeat protein